MVPFWIARVVLLYGSGEIKSRGLRLHFGTGHIAGLIGSDRSVVSKWTCVSTCRFGIFPKAMAIATHRSVGPNLTGVAASVAKA